MPVNYYGYGYGGWGILGIFWGIFWIVLIIVVIIMLIQWATGRGRRHHYRHWHGDWRDGGMHMPGRGALEVLKERYAKGEIDKQKFEEMKKDIEAP